MTPDIEAAFCADAVDAAARRLSPHVRETPLWRLRSADLGLPGDFEIWIKLEQLQVSGSFKARGVFNRLLSNPLPRSGVIVASGGNTGIATAFAANALNVRAEVYVPALITPAKRSRRENLGAKVVNGRRPIAQSRGRDQPSSHRAGVARGYTDAADEHRATWLVRPLRLPRSAASPDVAKR